MAGKAESEDWTDDGDGFVTNAVMIACIIGIIVVAALIVLSPRQKEAFTQLWLKPHKVQLLNTTADDEMVKMMLNRGYNGTPLLVAYVLGKPVYAYLRATVGTSELSFWDPSGQLRIVKEGETICLDTGYFFIDAVDYEGREALLFEYPRTIPQGRSDVRFAFVIENNEGEDHDYTANITLAQGMLNTSKLVRKISIPADQRKECTVRFLLNPQELREIGAGNYSKVSVRLDTGQEVFFWIGATA